MLLLELPAFFLKIEIKVLAKNNFGKVVVFPLMSVSVNIKVIVQHSDQTEVKTGEVYGFMYVKVSHVVL